MLNFYLAYKLPTPVQTLNKATLRSHPTQAKVGTHGGPNPDRRSASSMRIIMGEPLHLDHVIGLLQLRQTSVAAAIRSR